jgi:hypothetical protein
LTNLGSESETCVGSCVHLVGVFISFEKNFYQLSFTPPSLVRRIGPSPVQGSGSRPESACGVCGESPQNRHVTWLRHKTKTGGSTDGDGIRAPLRSFDAGGYTAASRGLRQEDANYSEGVTAR